MSFILWLLIAALHITLFVTIALATLRKGHYLLFWVGIISPCCGFSVRWRADCPGGGSWCRLTTPRRNAIECIDPRYPERFWRSPLRRTYPDLFGMIPGAEFAAEKRCSRSGHEHRLG